LLDRSFGGLFRGLFGGLLGESFDRSLGYGCNNRSRNRSRKRKLRLSLFCCGGSLSGNCLWMQLLNPVRNGRSGCWYILGRSYDFSMLRRSGCLGLLSRWW